MSYFRPKWSQQPQVPVGIDWSNKLSANITHCFPMNGNGHDVVTGKRITLTNGVLFPDSKGISLRGSGTQSCGSVALDLSKYDKLTVSFLLYWNAYANDDDFVMEFTSDSNNESGFYIDPNSATAAFACQIGTPGTLRKTITFPRPSAAAWHHYQITFDRTSTGNGMTVCVDGIAQTLGTVRAETTAGNFANSTLFLFSRNNANLFGAGRLQNLILRGGYLGTEVDAKAEVSNPYQIFKPINKPIFIQSEVPWEPEAQPVEHTITGTIQGSIAELFASADRSSSFTTHDTIATILANNPSIVGTANRTRDHSTFATIISSNPSIDGIVQRNATHTTTASIISNNTNVTGSASRKVVHLSSGTLSSSNTLLEALASHNIPHTTSGNITSANASISANSSRFRVFTTSGSITGQNPTIDAQVNRYREHNSSGSVLASGAVLDAQSNRYHVFTTTGSLEGQVSNITGLGTRYRVHSSTGQLLVDNAVLSAEAHRTLVHAVTGELIINTSNLSASSYRTRDHQINGSLTADTSILDAQTSHNIVHDALGQLLSSGTIVTGSANRFLEYRVAYDIYVSPNEDHILSADSRDALFGVENRDNILSVGSKYIFVPRITMINNLTSPSRSHSFTSAPTRAYTYASTNKSTSGLRT